MGHTPGPWSNHGGFDVSADCGVSCVAVTVSGHYPDGTHVSVEEQAANSHLIAAAPELLECLYELACHFAPKAAKASNEEWRENIAVLRKAVSVIAKAQGRGIDA